MKVKVEGKCDISATIVCDSVSPTGVRLTTMELTYPRIVHCFDDKTEVLVIKEGSDKPSFEPFETVVGTSAKVAQVYSDTLGVEFVTPSAWVKNKFNGDMIEFSNQRLSFSVTNEHRLFVGSRKSGYDKREVILAKDLLSDHTQKRFYKSGVLLNQSSYGKDFCKFVAFFLGDGHCPKVGKQAMFNLKKERKILEVKSLLEAIGKPFSLTVQKDGVSRIKFDRDEWMDECYTSDFKKKVPSFLFNMSQEDFEGFTEGLLESDGNVKNRDYNSFSEQLINDLQVIFHTHGKSFNIKKYGDCFKVKFQKEDTPILRKDKHKVFQKKYTGNVYCCSVPTGLIIVRRDGIVHISGNCEIMTHRMFSRNAASSRAIPFEKMLKQLNGRPVRFGAANKGMQDKGEHYEAGINFGEGLYAYDGQQAWDAAKEAAISVAKGFYEASYHKQVYNRLLEPFQIMKTVVTATEWNNFFHLRLDSAADPTIQELARCMKEAMEQSVPQLLQPGEWHLPFVRTTVNEHTLLQEFWVDNYDGKILSTDDAIKVSAARCAAVSFRNEDYGLEKCLEVYDRLVGDERVHASALEHQATPMSMAKCLDSSYDYSGWDEGVTHQDREGNLWSGNFRGWIQHRKTVTGENKSG